MILTYEQLCYTYIDPLFEKRGSNIYIPRDEAFSEAKQVAFSAKTVRSTLHMVIPTLEAAIIDEDLGFPNFTAVDSLFNEGVKLPSLKNDNKGFLKTLLPRLVKAITNTTDNVLRFEAPESMDSEKTNSYAIFGIAIYISVTLSLIN